MKTLLLLAFLAAPVASWAQSGPESAQDAATGFLAGFGASYLSLGAADLLIKDKRTRDLVTGFVHVALFSAYVANLNGSPEFRSPRAAGAFGGWVMAVSYKF